jgi:hypothetical protein
MRYAYSFAAASFALMLAPVPAIAQTMPLEFPLQKVESHIDNHGCLNFAATAVVDAQIEDLFEALSRPEELYSLGRPSVFVLAPLARESILQNAWTIRSPFAKIIEYDGPPGRAWGPGEIPLTWVKYTFVRATHTILEHTIGSTFGNSRRETGLALSPTLGGSATFIRYRSSECWPPAYATMSSSEKLESGEVEKRSLGHWLKLADADAHLLARRRLKAAPTAAASSP